MARHSIAKVGKGNWGKHVGWAKDKVSWDSETKTVIDKCIYYRLIIAKKKFYCSVIKHGMAFLNEY